MIRDWFRGFVVDPELEKKAHRFADQANSTADRAEKVAQNAEKLVNDAKRKLRTLNGVEVALVTTTVLIGSGVIIGTLLAQRKNSNVP